MDREAFRKRFNAYKNGKSVSEIYDAGLPKYAGGTPGEFPWYDIAASLLDRFEGFRDSVYLDGKGIPTIGYGFTDSSLVNKKTITKKEAQRVLKKEISSRGNRVRNIMGAEKWDKLNDNTKAALLSYYYNYPAGFADTTKMMTAWRKGDYNEFVKQIDAGMNDAANPGLRDRRLEEQRIIKEDPYLFPTQEKILDTTAAKYNAAHQFQPWENYHQPDYLLNNPAPSSISSWNNPGSPTFTTPELQSRRSYNNIKDVAFDIMNGKDVEDALMDNLSKNVFGGRKIGFKNGKLPGYYMGTIPFIDEEKKQKQEEWSDQWQERLQPSARSKVIQKWNATGSKPEPESSEEYTKRRTRETQWKKPSGRKMLEMAPSIVDAVPIASDVKQALQTGAAALRGNYLEASLLGGGLLLPGLFKKAGKNSLKLLSNDELYKAAVERGDKQEALRLLEDAYLNSGINKTPIVVDNNGHAVGWFHGSEWGNHTIFDSKAMNATIGGSSASGKIKGNFLTTDLPSAKRYAGSSRYSTTEDPKTTTPNTFVEKLQNLFGTYQPRFLYPSERVGGYAPKPERLFDTHGLAPINHLDKTDNVVYPMYVNPGENPMILDFDGKPWSQSPVQFPNNFYLERLVRDDAAKTYKRVIIPFKDKESATEAWMSDPINVHRGVTNLDDEYFDGGIRSIYAHNSAPRYEKVGLIEELVPNTTNGAVQTAAKEGNSSVLMKNVIDSNGGPDGQHYAIDDLATLKPEQMKLADITYDDAGNLIPLSKRFNWTNPDIRYMLAPFLIGGAGYGAYNKLSSYKNGKSPIHIKPANRGKFTALKKRTGHSASWFKENGTPEQKKMAVFALNAKKWKH